MDGQTDGHMEGWMYRGMDTDRWIDGLMDGRTDGEMKQRTDDLMNRQTDEWIDGWN